MLDDLSPAERQLLAHNLFPSGISSAQQADKVRVPAGKGIAIFLKKGKDQAMEEADAAYLHKVFGTKGLNLSPGDYAIIDAAIMQPTDLLAMIHDNQYKTVFCFNLNPAVLKINTRTPYTAVRQDGITFVFAHSLDVFQQNKEYRLAMLTVLQQLFA
jgi:hypothetical protein